MPFLMAKIQKQVTFSKEKKTVFKIYLKCKIYLPNNINTFNIIFVDYEIKEKFKKWNSENYSHVHH